MKCMMVSYMYDEVHDMVLYTWELQMEYPTHFKFF